MQHVTPNKDSMELLEIPTIMQIDEFLMVLGDYESPIKALHAIVTHKVDHRLDDAIINEDARMMKAKNEEQIIKGADLSPRSCKAMKSTKKRRKQ